jgi:Carboxypeptidase regulatory-like domain
MTIQTLYPVFESGQVLTEAALNTIIAYLEPQDRVSRSRLTGIGICCGFVPELREGGRAVVLSKGVAVTSEGYLIAQGEMRYLRRRPYRAPVPNGNATAEEMARARYPFLFDGGVQREAWEMLEPGAEEVPGGPPSVALDADFLNDQVVMLYLEERRDALKNCDVNDCSDKGAQLQLTLRPLLISRAMADMILAQEAALVPGQPVDRSAHPRLGLARLEVPRLLPHSIRPLTYPALFARQMELSLRGLIDANRRIGDAQRAYAAQLAPDFEPAGPRPHHLLPLPGHWAMMPVLAQSLLHGIQDLSLALDEALTSGAVLDSECLPDERRFPRHVLAGRVLPPDPPFADAPTDFAALAGFDPATIRQGPRAGMPPASHRHHFVPAPHLDPLAAQRFRTHWHRLQLMAQGYHASDLVGGDIRISPSRDGAAALGDRAIPAHYRVDAASALVANWNFDRRRNPSEPGPTGYRLIPGAAGEHPLLRRDDAVDFIRVEGVVGQALGDAWATILRQKRALGLGFAVQPVLMTLGDEVDEAEIARARPVFSQVLACRAKDLTSQLKVAASGLRPFLLWLMRSLAEADAGRSVRQPGLAVPPVQPEGLGFAVLALTPDVRASIGRMSEGLGRGLAPVPDGQDRGVTRRVLEAAEIRIEPAAGSVLTLSEALQAQGPGIDTLEGLARIGRAEGLGRVEADLRAQAALPGVSLLQRSEAVLDLLERLEIASLFEADLDRRISALLQAYDSYADRAETDPERAGPTTARINREIIASKSTLAALAAPLAGTALATEARQRLGAAFDDMVLPRFAARYPALEHKGGTPFAGTFVLLVCSRRMVEPMLQAALGGLGRDFATVWRRLFGSAPPAPDLASALQAIRRASRPTVDSALNDYVVMADLCLPTQCCDALCAEDMIAALLEQRPDRPLRPQPFPVRPIEPEPIRPVEPEPVRPVEPDPVRPIDPEPERRSGSLTGRVLRQGLRGRPEPVVEAEVLVTALEGDARFRAVTAARGVFEIELPSGRYTVTARFADARAEPQQVTVPAGEVARLDLTLQR